MGQMALRCHQHTHSSRVRSNSQYSSRSTPFSSRRVAVAAVKGSKQQTAVVQELLQLVQGTDRGLNTSAQLQESVLGKVEQLKAASGGSETTADSVLSATWKVQAVVKVEGKRTRAQSHGRYRLLCATQVQRAVAN
jgi:hypothetical protein